MYFTTATCSSRQSKAKQSTAQTPTLSSSTRRYAKANGWGVLRAAAKIARQKNNRDALPAHGTIPPSPPSPSSSPSSTPPRSTAAVDCDRPKTEPGSAGGWPVHHIRRKIDDSFGGMRGATAGCKHSACSFGERARSAAGCGKPSTSFREPKSVRDGFRRILPCSVLPTGRRSSIRRPVTHSGTFDLAGLASSKALRRHGKFDQKKIATLLSAYLLSADLKQPKLA